MGPVCLFVCPLCKRKPFDLELPRKECVAHGICNITVVRFGTIPDFGAFFLKIGPAIFCHIRSRHVRNGCYRRLMWQCFFAAFENPNNLTMPPKKQASLGRSTSAGRKKDAWEQESLTTSPGKTEEMTCKFRLCTENSASGLTSDPCWTEQLLIPF